MFLFYRHIQLILQSEKVVTGVTELNELTEAADGDLEVIINA